MSTWRVSILIVIAATALLSSNAQDDLDRGLVPKTAEQSVGIDIKSDDLTVVHLWAPWCSNCQAELKSGGWTRMIKDNPKVHFYFVSVWNGGQDGRAMLAKFGITDQPNITIVADPGPRGQDHIKEFAGLPVSWIPTTWIYKSGELRYALNYGEVRFPILQQMLTDSESKWSHKGEQPMPN